MNAMIYSTCHVHELTFVGANNLNMKISELVAETAKGGLYAKSSVRIVRGCWRIPVGT